MQPEKVEASTFGLEETLQNIVDFLKERNLTTQDCVKFLIESTGIVRVGDNLPGFNTTIYLNAPKEMISDDILSS